jgi:hypothetical protein
MADQGFMFCRVDGSVTLGHEDLLSVFQSGIVYVLNVKDFIKDTAGISCVTVKPSLLGNPIT